jgi:RND family efflux transporter MFP subunit
MKNRIKKKHYFILAGVFLIILAFFLFKNGDEEMDFVYVEKGNLVQELFETGSTEKGDDVKLGFKEGGRIENILVKEGEKVSRGAVVATVDKKDLELSLKEAEAILLSASATLDRFLKGATKEELIVVSAAVKSAEAALLSAENNLEEQEKITNEALRVVYQNVATLLGNIFSTVKEVEIGVEDLANTYFTGFVVSETTSGIRSRDRIRLNVEEIEKYKDLVIEEEVSFAKKEEALENTENKLKLIIIEIDNLIDVADSDFYKDKISSNEKELLRTYRGAVNTSLSQVIALLGNISSVNVETEATLTGLRGIVNSAKSALSQAEAELSRVVADPEGSDVIVREATITQARARVDLFKNRIADATLRSPVSGMISKILITRGEVVSPGIPVAIITPDQDIQIAVDIYEGDISKVAVGNNVKASFVAFPQEEFEGEVIFINPTGKLVDGVIYYEIKIMLFEYPEKILPQMTVDVIIRTAEKENVLLLPERAVKRKEGKQFVTVLENGEKIEKEIITELRGEGRMIEIVSGVTDGEKIIIE